MSKEENNTQRSTADLSRNELIKKNKEYEIFKGLMDFAVFSFRDEKVYECNSKACELFGYEEEELIGLSFVDLSPTRQLDGSDTLLRGKELAVHLMSTESPVKFEWIHIRKDGTSFRAKVIIFQADHSSDELTAYIEEIHEHEFIHKHKKLEHPQSPYLNFENMAENMPLAIQIFDSNGYLIYVNQFFRELFKIQKTGPALNYHVFSDPYLMKLNVQTWKVLCRDEGNINLPEFECNSFVERHGGSSAWVRGVFFSIQRTETEVYYVLTLQDLKENKETKEKIALSNQHLAQVEEELRATNEELYATNQSLTENFAHLELVNSELLASETRFNRIFEWAPIGMALIKERNILMVNNELCKLLKRSKESLLGEYSRFIYTSDLAFEEVGETIGEALNKEEVRLHQTVVQDSEGHEHPVLLSYTVLNKEDKTLIVSIQDLTEIKIAEENLQKVEMSYLQVFNSSTDAIFVHDYITHKIVDVNETACRLYGVSKDKMLTSNSGESILKKYNEGFNEKVKELAKETPLSYTADDFDLNENHFWTENNMKYAIINGKERVLVFARDISKRKKIELELEKYRNHLEQVVDKRTVELEKTITELNSAKQKLEGEIQEREAKQKELNSYKDHLEEIVRERTQEMERAKVRAEEADKLKTAFLANMSHEIRTPMNSILGFSQLLMTPDLPPEKLREYYRYVQNSSKDLLNLIDDIIDIAKIESNQLETKESDFEIDRILGDLVESFEEGMAMRMKPDVKIVYQKGKFAGERITTDVLRFRQIITNLVGNALKYTHNGFVEIGVLLDMSDKFMFYVKDTGIGISQEDIKFIFDRFRKIENDTTQLYRGAGLGLAITHRLVTMLGGDIWVESEPSKGSIFYFTLPRENNMLQIEEVDDVEFKGELKLHNKKVLVAEDEAANYKLVEVLLTNAGANVDWAQNGKKAIEKVAEGEAYDLVLMDIKMPVMDGTEAAGRLRKMYRDLPIIAQTAYAMIDEINRFSELFDDYITKPIDPKLFAKTIMKCIRE